VGITTDGTNLYVSDTGNHRIRKIVISTGVVTTLAGSSQGSTDHNTGTSASFNAPEGITTDGTNLYVSDTGNHRIRKIVISTGVVTTLAGSSSGSTDHNTGTSASFNAPRGITTDGTNLYVVDKGNHRIRKIVISTGVVTTLAGSSSGNTDATGTSASFNNPVGITTDGTNLYVADKDNDRIRKIVISTGVVTTLAGSSSGFANHNTGTSASFNAPQGITTDGTNLYVSDNGNHKIRKIE
jgi:sugar lactone lactonase YvrE